MEMKCNSTVFFLLQILGTAFSLPLDIIEVPQKVADKKNILKLMSSNLRHLPGIINLMLDSYYTDRNSPFQVSLKFLQAFSVHPSSNDFRNYLSRQRKNKKK